MTSGSSTERSFLGAECFATVTKNIFLFVQKGKKKSHPHQKFYNYFSGIPGEYRLGVLLLFYEQYPIK